MHPPYLRKRQALLHAWQHKHSISYAAAARAADCNKETAKRWLDKFRKGDFSLTDDEREGAPFKLSKQNRRRAARHLKQTEHGTLQSAAELCSRHMPEGQSVSAATVRRAVAMLTFKKKQYSAISSANVEARRNATTRAKIRQMESKLIGTAFTDASFVRFRPKSFIQGHRYQKCWEDPDEPKTEQHKSYTLVCFYAAIYMLPDGRVIHSPLIFVPPTPGTGSSLDARLYQHKVLTEWLRWKRKAWPDAESRWLQDGARPHKAQSTLTWARLRRMHFIDHPAQSPDMNPIEHVWLLLKKLVSHRRPESWETFYATMQKCFAEAVQKIGRQTILTLPGVMKEIHAKPEVHVKHVDFAACN